MPVYEQVNLPHAPCPSGIPYAVLFDHTGKVVAKGLPPDQLLEQVEALVEAAPNPPPKILGGLEPKACRAQAAQLAAGRPITPILNNLTTLAAKDDDPGKEAKQLMETVNAYVQKEVDRLKAEATTTPAATLCQLNDFILQIAGMSCEQTVKDLAAELKKDRNIVLLATTMQQVDDLLARTAKQKGPLGKADVAKLAKAKETIQKMISDGKASPAVVKEAGDYIKTF